MTFEPPYYAVIFTTERTALDDGYEEMSARMEELARRQPGFLGMESVRKDGRGVTVSYWTDEEAILRWKENLEHRRAQTLGRRKWYARYRLRVARVERAYEWDVGDSA